MEEYEFDYNTIIRDLIILLSIFNASGENNRYLKENNVKVTRFVEWEIIQETIISSAIRIRMIDDKTKKTIELPFESVGDEMSEKLTLREACNKIIHAKKFEPNESTQGFHLEPTISIEGNKGNEKWKYNIDIKKFVTNGITFLMQFLH